MHAIGTLGGTALLLIVLWDAFETVILPRRVRRRFRFTRTFYRTTWFPWRALGRRLSPGNRREDVLSVYGPLSLLLLLGLWAAMAIVAFATLNWGLGSRLQAPAGFQGFSVYLYYSGTTFFTLGLGDVSPGSNLARVLTVAEGGTGFGFLALILGYLPVLAQAFSRREVNVALLDARAGSPPSAVELFRRHTGDDGAAALGNLLAEWERWSADLLETHISFPLLVYYRSQHANQSWVAALTMVLDACALILTAEGRQHRHAAQLTFAMAQHAAADLRSIFRLAPQSPPQDRLAAPAMARLRQALAEVNLHLPDGDEELSRLRRLYEPNLYALGEFLLMQLPSWQ